MADQVLEWGSVRHLRRGQGSSLDLNQEAAESIAKELGETCLPVYADISDKSNLSSAIDQIIDWSGKIDILVNNAGVGHEPTPLDELSKTV